MKEDPEHCSRRAPRVPRGTWGLILLCALALLGGHGIAHAQYMFLDATGDSINDRDDSWYFLGRAGEPTTVDVYLVTDRDYYGDPAYCTPPPGLSSYLVNLYCPQSAAVFSNVENKMPGMSETTPLVTSPFGLTVGYSGPTTFPPGKYHLLRMTVTSDRILGCPHLEIVTSSCYSPAGAITSFSGGCPGDQGDGVLRMGSDWIGAVGFSVCTDFPGRTPSVTSPAQVTGEELQTLTFSTSVVDPDCSTWSYYAYPLPSGATFQGPGQFVSGEAKGTFTWRPRLGQAGTYSIKFTASDYPSPFTPQFKYWDTCSTLVTILPPRPPVAESGGPYVGIQGIPVQFDGTGTANPAGETLQYAWEFGDGAVGSGPTPTHVYASGGTFFIRLRVEDTSHRSSLDGTIATITAVHPARIFTTQGNQVTRFPRGKPSTCFEIEAASGSLFALEDVVPSSIRIHYGNPICGDHDVSASASKAPKIRDTDGNGLAEFEACFTQEGLAALAPCLGQGIQTLPLELWGSLVNGDLIRGEITHSFLRTGPQLASVSPNPLNAGSAVEFMTSREGFAKVQIFDVHGRLLTTSMDESSSRPGYHRIPLGAGARLASGVYFIRVATEHDGAETRAVTIVR